MSPWIILSVFALSAYAGPEKVPSGWDYLDEKEGVTIYRKQIEGSPLVAFGGDGMVDAPLIKVASVIYDSTRATEWVSDMKASRVVRWTGPLTYVEYDHIGTPIIMKDRDFVSDVKIQVKDGGRWTQFVYSATTDESVPDDGRRVRGELTGSLFELSSREEGHKTWIHAEVHCDPKGAVPKWIVNLFQRDWPLDTFMALRKQLKKKDIQDHPKMVEVLAHKS